MHDFTFFYSLFPIKLINAQRGGLYSYTAFSTSQRLVYIIYNTMRDIFYINNVHTYYI